MNVANATAPKLLVDSATKAYTTATGDLLALDQCSLDVFPNEIVSVVGPSGCGKTTLLWSMSGLHGLTSGEILLDGQPITGPHPDIGIVFQEANLLPWRDLDANINFPFEIKSDDTRSTMGQPSRGTSWPRRLRRSLSRENSQAGCSSVPPSCARYP